mmetsp:Transcript_4508/g.13249  ORF Transcript_4508/g.13249 Transcript_4508/m.13249 type:complete len:292 (-) Transcript_4508:1019-1894(-)
MAADLAVDVHDDRQHHIQHYQADEQDKCPDPRPCCPKVLFGQRRPVELALHGDLRARPDRAHDGGELVNPAPKDAHAREGVGNEGREEYYPKVQEVGRCRLQRAHDHCQVWLEPKVGEHPVHQDQDGVDKQSVEPEGEREGLVRDVVHSLSLGRRGHVRCKAFKALVDRRDQRGLVRVAADNCPDEDDSGHGGEAALLQQVPSEAVLEAGHEESVDADGRVSQHEEQEENVGQRLEAVLHLPQAKRLELDHVKDAAAPAEGKDRAQADEARVAVLGIHQKRLDLHSGRLLI